MTNLEKYKKIFIANLGVKEEDLPGLKYRGIQQWDSVGHMDIMADLEAEFGITMDTIDILDFTSYKKGKEVLAEYGVEIEKEAEEE